MCKFLSWFNAKPFVAFKLPMQKKFYSILWCHKKQSKIPLFFCSEIVLNYVKFDRVPSFDAEFL